ncbi:NAD(P)/FAD-dependent oxidoreductase [Sinimarinibacterium sp. NLF-5-8]|uniref:flavin-containing monooxygenase n=1 Tax=Sinimarinibacterium sp. NLF-5-8 TaxID=2698684 RepID=UPI00137BB3CF|nr:NAD(P)/FAD-dependent oxidoreductase [Sinimarinibacterium sp. NLF-5-8]
MNQPAATTADHHRIAIIGSGFSGLGMAIQLKQHGMNDFVLFEKEAGVGGTWRVNHYPGCACDVQSHLYSFSFEPNPHWTRMFAPQPEIKGYLERCAVKYGVIAHVRPNTEIRQVRWDEATARWHITDANGITSTANVLISGMGGLSIPSYPNVKGLEKFKGKAFHSQQWDHDYDLTGKRVAVIGTGASAIQFIPEIQKQVAHLDLYQRTPAWVLPKPDRKISRLEQTLFERFPLLQKSLRGALYTQLESRAVAFDLQPRLMKAVGAIAKLYIRSKVKDPELRRKLTPDYTIGCKRILMSDTYYPALTQPNVDVITDGIREVRAHSIIDSNGVERKVDAIIFGTGFKAADPVPRGVVSGIDGVDLVDCWPEGPEAYKGACVSGFPNLFFLMGPNTGLGHNSMVYMIESQIAYVLDAIKTMDERNLASVDVRASEQARFNEGLQKQHKNTIWSVGGCDSWYLHPVSGRNVTLWPGFTWQFRQQTRQFDPLAYTLKPAGKARSLGNDKAAARARSTAVPA